MFYLVEKTEDLSPGDSFSDSLEGRLQRSPGGAWIYKSFCNKKNPGSLNVKRLLLVKEIRHLKVMNVTLFFVWKDARVWASCVIPS